MTDPFDNDGKFLVNPDRVLMALLPDRRRAELVIDALRAAGHPLDRVKVLHGEAGARVLDRRGEYHGFFARLQRWRQAHAVHYFGFGTVETLSGA